MDTSNQDQTARMDAYLRKQLPPEEMAAFEQELQENPSLKEALSLHLQALIAVRQAGFREETTQGLADPSPVVKPLNWRRWAVAASVAGLVGLGAWWWVNRATPDPQALFAQYYYQPEASLDVRGTQVGEDTTYTDLLSLYEQAAFTPFLSQIHEIPKDSLTLATHSWFQLLGGISHLEMQQPDSALHYFSRAHQHPYQQQWYTAMTYLQQTKLPEAKNLLRAMVADDQHPYQPQASALLKALE
ncbi:MAG: hypothetical protein AAFR61_08565 [Bacteroidota bacterium]